MQQKLWCVGKKKKNFLKIKTQINQISKNGSKSEHKLVRF